MKPAVFQAVADDVYLENERQDAKWGEQNPPDGTGGPFWQAMSAEVRMSCDRAFGDGFGTWRHILAEEVYEAFAEEDPAKLRAELIQVAAVAMQWVAALDRRRK